MKRILVPIDFSDLTDRVMSVTADVARSCGAKVWLMHCIASSSSAAAIYEEPTMLPLTGKLLTENSSGQYRELTRLTKSLQSNGIDAEMIFVCCNVVHEILSAVDELQIDLIIMGSHGHGALYDLFVGSTARSLLYSTKTPTLIVPGEAPKETLHETAYTGEWSEQMATPY